ncbi:CocE/NonD family hydrolase [Agromyces tropicus]|uniref:CocE/NonD family hydrolase n=1 Tax=Agromyces tropicus TaxID=555371 RepID=A0ABP5FJU2_9MICO
MSFRVRKNVMVPMRDGVRLATDLWIPEGDGHENDMPRPTLLVRLPYTKDLFPANEFDYPTMPNIFRLLEAGYAIVYQDCRGTGSSEGRFVPLASEAEDGADMISWLRDQPWCNGSIGTFGHSYLGMTQWALATEAPEGLKAMVPTITAIDAYRSFWYSDGGAVSWHTVWSWTDLMLMLPTRDTADHPRTAPVIAGEAAGMLAQAEGEMAHLPLIDHPLYREVWPWWAEFLAHPTFDDHWRSQLAVDKLDRVTAPALHIAGWFDIFAPDMARAFARATTETGTGAARAGQRLIIGPWDHMHFTGDYADRSFGLEAGLTALDLTQSYLDYFDRHVRGIDDSADLAPVRIFVMGADEWRDEPSWPLPDTAYTDYFLSSVEGANSSLGDGRLSPDAPQVQGADTIDYDPADPVPTLGGRLIAPASLNAVGPVDQRAVEERADVLCYSTEVLDEPVEVTGFVSASLFVSSTAVDTDVTAKLVDVFPDGRAIYLTDGILRLRYRDSLSEPALLEPGRAYEVEIDMGVTSNVFLAGHRIRLEVSSSSFPRYDRNLNTGRDVATDAHGIAATNRIHFTSLQPSRLTLPVIRRD